MSLEKRNAKVVNCNTEPYDIYIGRPSKWGNPYSHIPGAAPWPVECREHAITLYEDYIQSNPELLAAAKVELKGKILGCHCKPLDCHGDILVRIANEI